MKIFMLCFIQLLCNLSLICQTDSDLVEEYIAVGKDRMLNKDYVGAIGEFNKALAISPDWHVALNLRSKAKFELKDTRGALSDIDKVIKWKEDKARNILEGKYDLILVEDYFHRAKYKAALKRYTDALIDINKAIKIAPSDCSLYNLRGLIYILNDQIENGCDDFSRAGDLGCLGTYEMIKEYCK